VPSKEILVRQPDFSPRRLPADWLKAVREAQTREATAHLPPIPRDQSLGKDPPDLYEHSAELETLIETLRNQRAEQGLSLNDIARASHQARSAISRLENGRYINPTLHTLYRYARALGWHIKLCAEPLTEAQRAEDATRAMERE
jgi:DNA-binding XRE family transcriptional regulator